MKGFLSIVVASASFWAAPLVAQSFSGQVDSQWGSPKKVFQRIDAKLHAGEVINIQVSGSVCYFHDHHVETHGIWPFQQDVTIDRSYMMSYDAARVEGQLLKDPTDNQSANLTPIPPAGQALYVQPGPQGIRTKADVQAFVPNISDRAKSFGTFDIHGELDVSGRLDLLASYLNSGRRTANELSADDVVCIHLRTYAPTKVANLIVGHADYPGANWSFEDLEALFRLALQIDPNNQQALQRLTKLYVDNGRFEQADQQLKSRFDDLRIKLASNPHSPEINAQYATALMQMAEIDFRRQLGIDDGGLRRADLLLADAATHFEQGGDSLGVRDSLVFRARVLQRLRFSGGTDSQGQTTPSALEAAADCLEKARRLTPVEYKDSVPLVGSPDGRYLLTCRPRIGVLMTTTRGDFDNGKLFLDPEGVKLLPLAISTAGRLLVRRGEADVGWWHPSADGTNFSFESIGVARAIHGVVEGDSAVVVTKDDTVVFYGSSNTMVVIKKPNPGDFVLDMTVAGSGSRCAVSFWSPTNPPNSKGTIQVWSSTGELVNTYSFAGQVNNLALSKDGNRLLAFQMGNLLFGVAEPATWMCFNADENESQHKSLTLDPKLLAPPPPFPSWVPPTFPGQKTPYNQSATRSASFSPDGKRIFLSNLRSGIAVFDAETLEHKQTITLTNGWGDFGTITCHRWCEDKILAFSMSRPLFGSPTNLQAVAIQSDLKLLKQENVNLGWVEWNLSVPVASLAWGGEGFVVCSPAMRNDYTVLRFTDVAGRPEVVHELPSTKAPITRLFYFTGFSPRIPLNTVSLLLESGKYAVFYDYALGLRTIDLETGKSMFTFDNPTILYIFADGVSWAVGSQVDATNWTFDVLRGFKLQAQFQTAPPAIYMDHGASTTMLNAFPTSPLEVNSGSPPDGWHANWTWYGPNGGAVATNSVEGRTTKDIYEFLIGAFYFDSPYVLMLTQHPSSASGADVVHLRSDGSREVLCHYPSLPAGYSDVISCFPSASNRRFCLLDLWSKFPSAPTPAPVGSSVASVRVFDIGADGIAKERKLACISGFDQSIFQSKFSNSPPFCFDPGLQKLMLPDGDRIKVISLDEDRVLGTMPLASLVEIHSNYAILGTAAGMQIAQWK